MFSSCRNNENDAQMMLSERVRPDSNCSREQCTFRTMGTMRMLRTMHIPQTVCENNAHSAMHMLRTMHIPQTACEDNAHCADQCYLRTLRNESNAHSAKSSLNVVVREATAVLQLLAGEDSQQSKVLPIKVFTKICRPNLDATTRHTNHQSMAFTRMNRFT